MKHYKQRVISNVGLVFLLVSVLTLLFMAPAMAAVPGQVTGLRITTSSAVLNSGIWYVKANSSVEITWDAPASPVDGYKYYIDSSMGMKYSASNNYITISQYTGEHNIYVQAYNNEGDGTAVFITVISLDKPNAPASITPVINPTRFPPSWTWPSFTSVNPLHANIFQAYELKFYENGNLKYTDEKTSEFTLGIAFDTTKGGILINGNNYTLGIIYKDILGNLSDETKSIIRYDNEKPDVTGVHVTATPSVTNHPPVLTWNLAATDNVTLQKDIKYNIYKNDDITPLNGVTPISGSVFDTNGTSFTNGISYYFSLKAVDEAGNVSDPAVSNTIVYDTQPPANPSYSIASLVKVPAQTISWTPETGASYIVLLNGNQATVDQTAPTYSSALTLVEGLNHISVQAYDNAGNYSQTTLRDVTLDDINPAINISNGADGSILNINTASTMIIKMNDGSGSGVNLSDFHNYSVIITTGSTTINCTPTATTSDTIYCLLTVTQLNAILQNGGQFTITATATDRAGNSNTSIKSYTIANKRLGFGFGRLRF